MEVAKALYADVKEAGGKVLFFCVAGQNRSAALAIAVLLLYGHSLETVLQNCSQTRPWILENVGFQKQLVELEAMLAKIDRDRHQGAKRPKRYSYGTIHPLNSVTLSISQQKLEASLVEIELLIPGLCTMDVKIPMECTIAQVKKSLVDYANKHLLAYSNPPVEVAKSWVVL